MARVPVLLQLFLVFPVLCQAEPGWRWEDDFSAAEKQHLQTWIRETEQGLTRLVGALPYRYRVHFHHRTRGRGPVPWANTDKRRGRAVHFYVNTAYAWLLFKKDWTASHELAHLMFPYLGDNGKWFAEGLASYLQYQIMYASGTINWRQASARYKERFEAARRQHHNADMSLVSLSSLRGGNVRLYWGGAAYFLHADRALHEERGLRLSDVITTYLQCCMSRGWYSAQKMIEDFDRLSESDIFTRLYESIILQKGFPDTARELDWLAKHPPPLQGESGQR